MAEKVIFPQLTGQNWPSNVMHVWLELHRSGVSPQNIRFSPEFGHVSTPEVLIEKFDEDPFPEADDIELRHPTEPEYDMAGDRLLCRMVDPEQVRPRLKVHIRAETLWHFYTDAGGNEGFREHVVGRLAHFFEPMMAPLTPGLAEENQDYAHVTPLTRLTREVCDRYPEMMVTLDPGLRDVLNKICERMGIALNTNDAAALGRELRAMIDSFYVAGKLKPFAVELAQGVSIITSAESADPYELQEAFRGLSEKVTLPGAEEMPPDLLRRSLARFRRWASVIFVPEPDERNHELDYFLEGFNPEEAQRQRALFTAMQHVLAHEHRGAREQIVREMLEIMTTEAFTATAVTDYYWGLGFIHGPVEDYKINPGRDRLGGSFMSMTGGLDHRTLLQILMMRWAKHEAFLGIGQPEQPRYNEPVTGRERMDVNSLNEGEQAELWALAAWRRDTSDPVALLETGLRRLIHPEATVQLHRFLPIPSRIGFLSAQPMQQGMLGGTAVLGGRGMLQYPGVVIHLPLAEDADDEAMRAKNVLTILIRLFLPICFHVRVVWQEALARLGHGAYLKHDFQTGVRIADDWAVVNAKEDAASEDRVTL